MGARSGRRAADRTVALWAASGDTRNGLYLSILDASRKPVFVQDGLRLQAPMHPVDVGGDLAIPLQASAIALLPAMRGHEALVNEVQA